MSDNELDKSEQDPSGPPPTEPNVKKRPDEVLMAAMPAELRTLFEKVIADKVNAERNFNTVDKRLRETEQKLNQINKEKEDAEAAKLAEQGKFKELAEQAAQKAKELEEKLLSRDIQLNLDRALSAAGAADVELLSTALSAKYGDELRADPSKAQSLVERMKEEKPLFFKASEVKTEQAPTKPAPQPTGQAGQTPPTGNTSPTQFDARDRKIPLKDVEDQYREMMKNATF
jgi:predicted phage tail protein